MVSEHAEITHFSQERDFWGNLKRDLQELRGISTLVYELIQNADDVKTLDGAPGGAHSIVFDIREDGLIVENDGLFSDCGQLAQLECPWKDTLGHRCDFHRMKQVGGGDKRNQSDNTGAFGIGFNAVYQITDHPEIISNGWHWRFYPENTRDERIVANKPGRTEGTRFFLPWAFDPNSKVRQELRGSPAIRPEQIKVFEQEIAIALQKAAIFLKQITSLELSRDGRTICCIERRELGENIEIWINGQKTTWRIFLGDFSIEANELRKKYRGAIEDTRRSHVAIAVPDSLFVDGYLFADLPTEMSANLPFHIEADFFPSSDRKRILLDDSISSEWNRQVIRSAAALVVSSFDKIVNLFPAIQLWDWIAQIHKGGKEATIDRSFETFWDSLSQVLPHKSVLLTSKNDNTFLNSACLLESDEEISATDVWEDLGINVVHPDLRKHYTLFQELGTPRLRLADITHGLKKKGITDTRPIKQAPTALRTIAGFQKMWKAVNQIWNSRTRSSGEERDAAARELAGCAIAVGVDGNIHPPRILYKGETAIQQIFPEIKWLKIVPDSDPIPTSLVHQFSISEAASYLKSLPADKIETRWLAGKFSLENFYRWLENHRDEVLYNQTLYTQLRELPIWPAGGHLQPITGLYLPGGFDDQLGLASVINVAALGGRSEYLRDVLKVKSLDFPTYIREQIPQAFNDDGQVLELRTKLVLQLALRLGEIRDYADIRYILQKLPLVECQDGEFYSAADVYFDNQVNRVLGEGLKLAIQPEDNTSAIEQLYEWLGVARQPRDEDILSRIQSLVAQAPNPSSIKAVETLFTYLGQSWKAFPQADSPEKRLFEQHFGSLKRLRWLPGSRNPDQWFSPDTLYTIFNKYWFETQGNFLSFSDAVQRDASKFLEEFLIINSRPIPIYVVRHILYCSENNIAVNWQVYNFLSFKESLAEELVLRELEGKHCILVTDDPVVYVRPDQVFWNDHPFGPYRYKLGPGLRAYEELFARLGVRTDPEIHDYIQVLMDISEQFGNNPLDEGSTGIVMSCWRKLSDALSNNQITQDDLKEKLCHKKVIPDPRHVLTVPEHLFFEDRAGLAVRFEALLKNNVIQRTEGCWLAMEAVGVQLLSRLIEVDLSKEIDAEPDQYLLNRIQERKLLVQRIIDAEQTAGSELASREKLLSLDYQRAEEIEIVMTIRAFNRRYQTEPEKANAVLKDSTFYSVWTEDTPSWAAISRELALAIKPSGEIGSLAMGIKEVLSAPSYQIASVSLDELNYPPLLESEPHPEIPGAVADVEVDDPLAAILGGDTPDIPPAPATPPEDPTLGGGKKGGGGKPKPRRRTSRIITYVYPDDALLPPREKPDTTSRKRTATEQAGVDHVLADEDKYHRDAIDRNKDTPNHPGYDLESTDRETGMVRYIEVKSISGYWDSANPILMTQNEFEMAQAKGDEYWLYIVERATSEDRQIYRIQNPANRANYFVYDHGWEPLAFSEGVE